MAHFDSCRSVSVLAAAATAAYLFLTIDGNGRAAVNTTANGPVDGISGEGVDAIDKVLPMLLPDGAKAKVTAGNNITQGALVMSDNAGKAIPWVDAVGNKAVGRALFAAANGDIVTILFGLKSVGAGS